jgi:hypothetical protein
VQQRICHRWRICLAADFGSASSLFCIAVS